jgi:quinol monooxygenase YgiN
MACGAAVPRVARMFLPSTAGTSDAELPAGGCGADGAPPCDDVAVLLLADLMPGHRAWGCWRLARGAAGLRGVPGLRFAKVLGSGRDGGFGLRPSLSRQGLFALFDNEADADAFLSDSPTAAAYREHAAELCTVKLRATSSRGRWSGQVIGVSAATSLAGRVAALTRASIRPLRARRFWRQSPHAEAALRAADGCLLAVGLGEAPLLRQATFSVWRDQAAMDTYARSGAHQQAIVAAQREGWFSESMFVRFEPLQLRGRWQGHVHG